MFIANNNIITVSTNKLKGIFRAPSGQILVLYVCQFLVCVKIGDVYYDHLQQLESLRY
jgi:hypothetical protein